MGIFGTSKDEESKLREAVLVNQPTDSEARRGSKVSTTTTDSSYQTADEYDHGLNRQSTISRQSTTYDDALSNLHTSHDEFSLVNDDTNLTIRQIHENDGVGTQNTTFDNSTIEQLIESADESSANAVLPQVLKDEPIEQQYERYQQYLSEPTANTDAQSGNTEDKSYSVEDELNKQYTLERSNTHLSQSEIFHSELQAELSKISEFPNDDNNNEEEIDPLTLDWDSADDKGNPLNWPSWRKWLCTMTVAMICLMVSLGSSLYISGVPELATSMNVSEELCIAGLTLYLVGLAGGPVIAAPLSELIGRKYIYVFSLPISMLFMMGVGLSTNIESVLILRFFTGLFASPAMAVAGGTVTDVFRPEEMGTGMSLFCLAAFLGPVLGPVIGGFVAARENWRWTLWVNLMGSGIVLPFVLSLPETYKPAILKSRAKKRGLKLKKTIVDLNYLKKYCSVTLIRPLEMLVVEPIVMVFSIYIAFVFAVLFGFFEAFPIIFSGVYNMQQDIAGLPFISVGIGLILGVLFYLYFDHYVYFKKNQDGTRGNRDADNKLIWDPPETKLLVCKVGAVCLPISLFWLAWTSRETVHWMAPTASAIPFGFGLILIFFTTIQYFSLSYPAISVASALAANNLLRYLTASVFPLFTVQMYDRLGIDWATSLFAFISLAMVPVPWIFEKYGPKLRSKSKFGYAALFREKAAAAAAMIETETTTPKGNISLSHDSSDDKQSAVHSFNQV